MGCRHLKPNCRVCARARRPRPRICLRKGCGCKYQPRRWNQRYCQDSECLRQVRRWQAARRQAKRRRGEAAKTQPAEAQVARRRRTRTALQPPKEPEVTSKRGHAAEIIFATPLCGRPGCHEPPVKSIRNRGCFCSPACRQAVRRVLDRERKWRSRSTLRGRRPRISACQAARAQRCKQQHDTPRATPARASPP